MPILSIILRVFLKFEKGRTKEPLERWEKIYSAVSRAPSSMSVMKEAYESRL